MVLGVYGEWRSFALFTQVVVGTIGVNAFEPHASDAGVAAYILFSYTQIRLR